MVLIKKHTVLCLVFVFFSCLTEADKKEDTEALTSKKVKVEVSLKSNIAAKIKVKFLDFIVDFNQDASYEVSQKINGDNVIENLEFSMFKDYLKPTKILINLGNESPKEMIIEKIILSYDENKIIINGNQIKKYFNHNKFINLNSKGEIVTNKIENKHIPLLTLRPQILKTLYK